MHSEPLHCKPTGKLMAIIIGCAVISGIIAVSLINPLYAGVLPQDGDARYELVFWESIKDSTRAEDYEAYLQAYPEGRFAPLARARAAYLSKVNDSAPVTPARKAPAKPLRQAPSTPALNIDEMKAPYKVLRTANLREDPWTKSPVVGLLKKGDKIQATGRVVGRNWFRIITTTGLSGYVYGDLIKKSIPASPAKNPVSAAAKDRAESRQNSAINKLLKTFKDCQQCPQMVVLPAGKFVMGDARGDITEKPAHTVTIAQPFAIGKHEVTLVEWNACVLDGACSSISDIITGADPVTPVRDVSWTDTGQYIGWLNARTGKSYRLPTEAEWEYAVRGGTKTRYWWGNRLVKGMANCTDCGGEYDRKSPAVTGSFDPNPFGLHEMNGGVWEWVLDCWHRNYKGAPKDGSAWDKKFCRERVLRGGSWRNDSSYAHSAGRFKYDEDVRYFANGFRVARPL